MSTNIPGLGRATEGKTPSERIPIAKRSTATLLAELRRFDRENDYTLKLRNEIARRTCDGHV